MTRIIGYLRPDMNGLNTQSQLDRLEAAGATKIFHELSDSSKVDRPKLNELMSEIRDGDSVVVTSLDRIAQSTRHLLEIVESLNASGASIKVIDNGIDTSTDHGEVMRMLLAALADFERQVVRENQAAGIAKAKREGRYKGRKPTARAKADEVMALNTQGLTRQKIADQLGIGVASVYRILKNHAVTEAKLKKPLKKKTIVKKKIVNNKATQEHQAEQLSFF